MAGKHEAKGLLVSLEKGELGVETAHPRAGDTIEVAGLPQLKKVFEQLADKMALSGKISEQDGMVYFCGRAKNGEETEFSHNVCQPGMPFELTVTTSRTVSVNASNGKEVVLSTLEPAFRQDTLRALERAGKNPNEKLTSVSEKVTVRTLARLEWFPGMFEDSGTLYRVTRLIRKDIGWEVCFGNFSGEQLPVLQKQQPVSSEVPVIQFAEGKPVPSRREADLDHLFSGMAGQDSVQAEHGSIAPQLVTVSDVRKTENTTNDAQLLQQEVLVDTEPETELEQHSKPEKELEYIDVQEMQPEQSEAKQHNKLAEMKSISPEMYIQQLMNRLNSQAVQSTILPVSSDTQSVLSVAGMQAIPQLTQQPGQNAQLEVVEAVPSHMDLQHEGRQSVSDNSHWNPLIKHTSDNVVDNILADVDEWTRQSRKRSVKRPDSTISKSKHKSITHFFRR